MIIGAVVSCSSGGQLKNETAYKVIDTGEFTVKAPKGWKYIKERGIDSFVGRFEFRSIKIHFDYSDFGYSWRLPISLETYLNGTRERKPEWIPVCPFCEQGTIWVSARHVEKYRAEKLKEVGEEEFKKLKIEAFLPDDYTWVVLEEFDRSKYPEADYLGSVSWQGKTKWFPIEVPEEVKNNTVEYGETRNFWIKRALAKPGVKGYTGILFISKTSELSLVLYTDSRLNESEKQEVLGILDSVKLNCCEL